MLRDDRVDGLDTAGTIEVLRHYVTDFVNRHDFGVLPSIMHEDYTLDTSGALIAGRDGPYRSAVAQQFEQFPGLMFTIHELFICGSQIGIRFTEHGASIRHAGSRAAWPSIAIYEIRDGLLARCTIEQDYYSRRRQLANGDPITVDPPAIAPWDESPGSPDPTAASVVVGWLERGDWLNCPAVQVDDAHATGRTEQIVEQGAIAIDKIVAANGKVAFHALLSGLVATDFAALTGAAAGQPVSLYLSGLVTVIEGRVVAGNIIRDRWGAFRRLSGSLRKSGNLRG